MEWVKEGVSSINGAENKLQTNAGENYSYDYLVICPGVKLRYDKIEGASSALDDPNSAVGSIYRLDYAYKASALRDSFKGGKAVFTLPTMPIKCGGAP